MTTPLWRGTSLMALLILGTVAACAEPAPSTANDIAWQDTQRAAQAKNPPGVTCTLRTLNGQTRLQQGATIRLVADFASDRPGYKLNGYNDGRRGMFPFGTIHVAPTLGATDPTADWPPPHGWAYEGPGPPAPVALSDKPVALRFVLNDWLRFDQPGFYRVYVTTQRVFVDTGKPFKGGFAELFSPGSLEVTSDILQFEIVPADPAWAHAQVEEQQKRWADKTEHYTAQAYLEGELEYLGTREAMQTIIKRMGANTRPRSSEDETWYWQPAFIGFPDRDWLIAEMERAVARPDYAVTQGFVDTLALLAAMRRLPHPAGADATLPHSIRDVQGRWVADRTPAQQLQADWEARLDQAHAGFLSGVWQRVAGAVATKSGAVRAMSLHTLLELAWLDKRLGKDATIQGKVPQLVAQLAPIFDQLPPLPQEYLLGSEWPRLKSPLFLPALRRLWHTAQEPSNRQSRLSNLIGSRLLELSPHESPDGYPEEHKQVEAISHQQLP